MAGKHYILTARAAADLREARAWSRARWGKVLTDRYFADLHRGANLIARTRDTACQRPELAGGTELLISPVREHYIVYEPVGKEFIAIVSVIRQGRDIPTILNKWAAPIRSELLALRARIARGAIALPGGARGVRRPRASGSRSTRKSRK